MGMDNQWVDISDLASSTKHIEYSWLEESKRTEEIHGARGRAGAGKTGQNARQSSWLRRR